MTCQEQLRVEGSKISGRKKKFPTLTGLEAAILTKTE